MRDGIEYEFTTVLEIGMDHKATPSKDRTGLFIDRTFQIDERTGELIAGWLSGTPQPDYSTETDSFLNLIHNADSKSTLNKIGLKIKESTLPESVKAAIREVYKERFNSLA